MFQAGIQDLGPDLQAFITENPMVHITGFGKGDGEWGI